MKTKKKIDHGPAQSFSLEQLLMEYLQPAVCTALYAVVEKEVAAMVGFEDPLHFSRMFRNVHGVSPQQLRDSLNASAPG